LLVGHKWLVFVDVVEFAISETDVVALIKTSPDGCEDVGNRKEEELGYIENVQEFGSVPDVEPHPVAVGLEAHGLLPEQLDIVGATTGPPVSVRLVLVQEAGAILFSVLVVRVSHFN
jgi:hypothetical protein